jgi:Cu/Zn superoxide dismutase
VISESKLLDLISLTGKNSVIGHAVVLHELTDQCGDNNGNAGARIAFGVIGIGNPRYGKFTENSA